MANNKTDAAMSVDASAMISEGMKAASSLGVDLAKPRWSQDTYAGRAQHFITITNPLNVFASSAKLESARSLVKQYE